MRDSGNGCLVAISIGALTNAQSHGCISPIPAVVTQDQISIADPLLGEGGFMYLLFGPAMAALVVIAVIQLRDHFVASRMD